MKVVSIQQILQAETQVQPFSTTDPTNYSYREFLAFFHARPTLSPHDITIGAYMVYGWMPRGLNIFDINHLGEIVAIINRAKLGQFPLDEELALLFQSINHSLVGPSKLLHFVNPSMFGIWDSRVYRFIEGKDPTQEAINSIENYRAYHRNLHALIVASTFRQVHDSMNHKIGYWVTPMRACEYVMYVRGLSTDNTEPLR